MNSVFFRSALRTVYHLGKAIKYYNIRLTQAPIVAEEIKEYLNEIYKLQTSNFKINASFGVLLRNVETVSHILFPVTFLQSVTYTGRTALFLVFGHRQPVIRDHETGYVSRGFQ